MAEWIRITNKGTVNRLYLEKLGLSGSRNDPDKIGQFGSGAKLAPIAALRRGYRWITMSTDAKGKYTMEYVIHDDEDVPSVFYQYDDGTLKPSSFTLDAGCLSWDSPWQILREAIANAWDADYNFEVTLTDTLTPPPDNTTYVYLSADDALVDIVNNLLDYFDPANGTQSWVKPSTHGDTRIYCKGVLVYQSDEPSVLYYNINKLELNEERNIRKLDKIGLEVVYALSGTCNRSAIEKWITTTEDLYQDVRWAGLTYPVYYVTDEWTKAWNEIYGPNVVAIKEDQDAPAWLALDGYTTVRVPDGVYNVISAAVPTIDKLKYTASFKETTLTGQRLSKYVQALTIVREYEPAIDRWPIMIFTPRNEHQTQTWGVCDYENECYRFNERLFDEPLETIIGTMVHECDHMLSGYKDNDPKFRAVADTRIGKLLMQQKGK